LAPNRALKEAIDAFRAANPNAVAKVVPKSLNAGSIGVSLQAFARPGPDGTHDIVVTMDAGAGRERSPLDLVCVIDISGSMQNEASVSDEKGVKEEHGLSLLDITKHAVATVINTLGPQDRLSLVSYSDAARVELPLTAMNKDGQGRASKVLAGLHTEGSTNLWDGLLKGMEVLRGQAREGRFPSVFLLTDGQPNVAPPRGHLEMLKRYKDEHKISYTVNTFGFGYNLDSHLLDELATEGGGAYAFVPEPTFVGTCFVNALANTLVTASSDASIAVENLNGATFSAVLGGHPVAQASWGFKVCLE
jgi:Mg-chelatase subunit ChlD